MASESWSSRLSRRYLIKPNSDVYEEAELEDDSKAEFMCPFCAEDFDVLGLCCHVDEEHPVETKNGVCPVCAKRVGMDIVGHITTQHQSFFKVQRKRRMRKSASNSTFSILRKELRDGSLQSLLGGSSYFVPSTDPDPLLSSFMFSPSVVDEPHSVLPTSSVETSPVKESTIEDYREVEASPAMVSDKEQEEKSRRCEFVRSLVMSTILDEL
ncbi:Protein DEHYDRATION-INDUCED 19 homolog 7 [Linum perenne]